MLPSTIRTFIREHGRLLLLAAVFLLGFAFYYWNQRYLSYITIYNQDIIFGADNLEIVEALQKITFESDMRKHVLFSATLAPVVGFLQSLPLISFQRAVRLAYALLAGLNVLGAYYLLGKKGISGKVAFLFTALYALSFSNLVIYSIPETYQMSNLLIVLYLLILSRVRQRLSWSDGLWLSAIAGLAALYNYPLLSLLGIHLLLMLPRTPIKRWLGMAITNLALGIVIFLAVNFIVYQWEFLKFFQSYSSQWASVNNFLSADKVATVITNFFLFSVVSPVDHLPAVLGWQQVAGYFSTLWGGLLIVAWVVGLVFVGYRLLKGRGDSWESGALIAWILVMTLFYTYFNPTEALLYSSQILLPLVLIVAVAFGEKTRQGHTGWILLSVFCVLLAVNNCIALYAGVPGL